MLRGLGHVDLVCRDLPCSLDFYAAVLGPLGLVTEPFLVEGGAASRSTETFFLDPDS